MLSENLAVVKDRIKEALARRKGNFVTGSAVRIVAVTKNHPPAVITEALATALTDIGENRVQEAQAKQKVLGKSGRWHLIGHLQTNKAKLAVELFDLIESVDSLRLLFLLDKYAASRYKVQDVLLQLNLTGEVQKSGLSLAGYEEMRAHLAQFTHVRVRGLMTVARDTSDQEDIRQTFHKCYELFAELQDALGDSCDTLSMGMSGDYALAIEEGANSVRIGTALFGARDYGLKF